MICIHIIFCHRQIFICGQKVSAFCLSIVLHKNTFHNIGNLRFNRLKQDDQILHGTVSGTDIHTPDGVLDSLFHMGKCLLNFFNMSGSVRSGFQCEHYQVAAASASDNELLYIFILPGKIPVIQFKSTCIAATFAKRVCHLLKIPGSTW